MNFVDKMPILNSEKRQQKHYVRRWIGVLCLTLGGVFIKSTLTNNSPTPRNTEQTTVLSGQTAWSIATKENNTVANNPNLMAQQIQQIDNQIPKDQNGMLYPGETIYLPAGSKNGVPITKK